MNSTAVAAYHERGFAILPAIPEALRLRLSAALDAIIAQGPRLPPALLDLGLFERYLPDRKREGVPATATGDAIFLIGDPCRFDPSFAAGFTNPALMAAVRMALGTADLRCHFSNATIKSARVGSGIAWHRDADNAYMPSAKAAFVRAMICVDGMDATNGGTCFRPGSHLPAGPRADGDFVALRTRRHCAHPSARAAWRPTQPVALAAPQPDRAMGTAG